MMASIQPGAIGFAGNGALVYRTPHDAVNTVGESRRAPRGRWPRHGVLYTRFTFPVSPGYSSFIPALRLSGHGTP